MDLTAAAEARAARMSRLRAGDAAGGRGPERLLSGPTRQSGPWDSESIASQLDAACAGYFLF